MPPPSWPERRVPEVRHRRAARLVVRDEAGHLLLVRFDMDGRVWWATPGGGAEGQETPEETARREAREELGVDVVLRDVVWTEVIRFDAADGTRYEQSQVFFRADLLGEPTPDWEALAAEYVVDLSWWSPEAMEASEETIYPPGLADLVRALPREPVTEPTHLVQHT